MLIFGGAALANGTDRVWVTVDTGCTVGALLIAIASQHPRLAFATASARLAVNQAYAPNDCVVRETDEVALISLLGGG